MPTNQCVMCDRDEIALSLVNSTSYVVATETEFVCSICIQILLARPPKKLEAAQKRTSFGGLINIAKIMET